MPAIPAIFCLTLVLLGNYFMLNLMLAVVFESYIQSEERADEEVKKEYEQKMELQMKDI